MAPGASAVILVLSAGEEVAKRIESHLRNAGHPVRAAWVTDLEDMEDAIRRGTPDLVLVQQDMPQASVKETLKLCQKFSPDLPVLVLATKAFTMVDTVAALRTGVRGLVIAGDALQLQHLETICLRELGTHQTLRDLRSTRARLADYETRHEKLMAGTGDAVLHVQEGIVTHANSAFARLIGQKSAAAIQGNPLMDLLAAEGQAKVKDFLKAFARGTVKSDSVLELQLAGADGNTVKVVARATVGGQAQGERLLELLIRAPAPAAPAAAPPAPAPAPAPTPAAAPALAPAPPPAAPAAANGTPGRVELLQMLNTAITANIGMHRALMLVMVDAFAAVEERLGYNESESALAQVTDLVKQRAGPREPVYRLSTALVAIVISRPSTADFEPLAETVRRDIAAQVFKTEKFEAHLAATVLCYPLSATDKAADAVDAAVKDVRKLSRDGGNRVAVMGPAAQAAQALADEARKLDQIKKALAENRLKLAYQSIASLEGGDHGHFDVLARMLDEAGQEVPARDFIPTAEKFGLIVAIDRWVIARALTVLAKRSGAGDKSSLFVRLSEHSVREGDQLYKWLAEQLKARPLKKDELVVAIQESTIEAHVGKVKALRQALKTLGADVALDKFGSGDHSVKMCDHLAPQYVRFDYKFTKDFNDPKMQARMAELMASAKAASIKTIVGQVEDANAMARLWQLGVNYIQGFHIQQPEAVLLATDVR
jgi:EAL domain-containing protein (putative c-di-GMP-specific phosphodiesterase class I)/GGDEF domain-containing protein/PAS domain-containing protein